MRIESDGYKISTYDEILDEIVSDIKREIPNFNEDDSNVMMILNKKVATFVNAFSLLGANMYNNMSVSSATGSALDDKVSMVGVRRGLPTKSSTVLTLKGKSGTVVGATSTFSTKDGLVFAFDNKVNVTIPASGEIDVLVSSIEEGLKYNVPSMSITTIVNPVTGLDSVVNKSESYGGNDTMTDAELRDLYYTSLRGIGESTIEAVTAKVAELNGVYKANILENPSSVEKDGIPPHSFEVLVEGGDKDEILQSILASRPIGILPFTIASGTNPNGLTGYTEGLPIEFVGGAGSKYTVYKTAFTRPRHRGLKVYIEVKVNANHLAQNPIDSIKEAIVKYIDKNPIGHSITYGQLITEVYRASTDYINEIRTFVAWTGANKPSTGTAIDFTKNIDIDIRDMFTISASDVEVKEVA